VIAVDSSALLTFAFHDPGWEACLAKLDDEDLILVSAVILTETLVVAGRRKVLPTMREYLEAIELTIVPADDATAVRVSDVYQKWGKGNHPAQLNFCDCFSYDVARQFACPLLYIGNDFSQTDIPSALA
jgi:ribonuclease VapC